MNSETQIPHDFVCPISLNLMESPVSIVDGQLFDRDSIMKWFAKGGRKNPLTNIPLKSLNLLPNKELKRSIQEYKERVVEGGAVERKNEKVRNFQKKIFTENRSIKLFGSISQQMEMKRKQIEIFKENFSLWKKQFDDGMDEIENKVTIFGRKCYVGETKVGRRHGKGICYYENGSKYEGQWFHDYYHGKGVYTSPTGKVEFGQWKLGQLHGLGVYEDEVGCLYEGDLKYGTLTGKGVAYKQGRAYYQGEWKNGLRHGRGIRHLQQGKYEGEWKNGLRHGYGEVELYHPQYKVHQKWVFGELVVESDSLKECFAH